MMKRTVAALLLALTMVGLFGSAAVAQDPIFDSQIVDRVECLFRTYINEGGENGLDCLT